MFCFHLFLLFTPFGEGNSFWVWYTNAHNYIWYDESGIMHIDTPNWEINWYDENWQISFNKMNHGEALVFSTFTKRCLCQRGIEKASDNICLHWFQASKPLCLGFYTMKSTPWTLLVPKFEWLFVFIIYIVVFMCTICWNILYVKCLQLLQYWYLRCMFTCPYQLNRISTPKT
jgi:hypothetical protein